MVFMLAERSTSTGSDRRQLDAFFRPDGSVTQTCPATGCVYPGAFK